MRVPSGNDALCGSEGHSNKTPGHSLNFNGWIKCQSAGASARTAAMNGAVVKKTQDTLGKVIKKPPLTDKLLGKPPFRYLHDIFSEVRLTLALQLIITTTTTTTTIIQVEISVGTRRQQSTSDRYVHFIGVFKS